MDKKNREIVLITTIVFLAVIVIGTTYAFFKVQGENGGSTDVKANANTVDNFTFETGDPLLFTANQFTFNKGNGNKSASTYAKATLTANNKTKNVTDHYYLYLSITSNSFYYTQGSTPELLLNIFDNSGNEITSLEKMEYVTVTDASGKSLSGFDVTAKSGLIKILDNREITTTSSISEQWNITLTFVNYDFDQSPNAGKNFKAKLMIQKNEITYTLGDVDGDGVIKASDVSSIIQYLTRDLKLDDSQLGAADVNEDGIIDGIDIDILFYQYTADKINLPYKNTDVYNITYDLNGGMETKYLRKRYTSNFSMLSLYGPPSKDGYGFAGWTGSNGTDPEENVTVNSGTTGDLHYKANWAFLGDANLDGKINLVDVRAFNRYLNGYSVSSKFRKDVADVNRDGKVDYLDLDNVFRYVSTLGTAVEVPIDYIPDKIYNITYDLGGGAFVNDDGDGYEARDKYFEKSSVRNIPTPEKTGYTFLGWTGSNGDTPQTNFMYNTDKLEDLHYIANWQQNG